MELSRDHHGAALQDYVSEQKYSTSLKVLILLFSQILHASLVYRVYMLNYFGDMTITV